MTPKFLNRRAKVKTVLKSVTSEPNWKFLRWYTVCTKVRKDKKTSRKKKEKILQEMYYQLTADNCNRRDRWKYFYIMRSSEKYQLKIKKNGRTWYRNNPIGPPGFKRLRWRSYQGYLKGRDGKRYRRRKH